MKVLVIVPAFNEELNILKTIADLKKTKYKFNLDILVINDASTDNTNDLLIKNKIPSVKLIYNLGIGGAVQTGYKYAYENDYDIAIQFDGDGQHVASYIEELSEPIIRKEANLVIGSRFVKNIDTFKSTKLRRIGISVISKIIKIVSHKTITDPTSGFRSADKEVIKMFAINYPTEYPEPESIITLLKTNKTIKEISVEMKERKGGISSINSWKTVYYMINVCLAIIINSFKRSDR